MRACWRRIADDQTDVCAWVAAHECPSSSRVVAHSGDEYDAASTSAAGGGMGGNMLAAGVPCGLARDLHRGSEVMLELDELESAMVERDQLVAFRGQGYGVSTRAFT